ncbi:DinB family protein [Chitinophaga sp. XS-30]|uniref:DinB family protein n=1 Tax=Chitinophaga sp. XS-30 TaxID=2604421 RepID=UPI00143D6FCE|nr:DinB family protein [Chitinophaga sp. XS-30]
MKVLKKILIVLAILIAIPLIIALFLKKDYAVEREIAINKPKQEVFDYVKYLKNQDNYSKWAMMDPDMKKTYRGTDGTVGFVSAWDSEQKDVGAGEQEIKKITEGERIDFELRFIRPFESTEAAYMVTESASEDQTTVKWGFNGHMNYPMNLMMLFMDFEEMISNDLDTGLMRLKGILESRQTVADGSMEFLLGYFNRTTGDLEKSVAGLSEAQLKFKPAPDKWSVSQCLEHIVATEKMLFDMAKKELAKPAQPELKGEVKTSDAELIAAMTDRSEKHKTSKELEGAGLYTDPQTALNDLAAARKPVLDYIQNASLEDLRNHVSDYPTGKADGYQSLLFIAAHCARHTLQIDEVKGDANFPKN